MFIGPNRDRYRGAPLYHVLIKLIIMTSETIGKFKFSLNILVESSLK